MAAVTTSLVVQFTDPALAASSFLQAEIDSREDGLNKGVTQFRPGDRPGFLVFASPDLTLTFQSSSGNVVAEGSGTIEVEEFLTLANAASTNLSKLPYSTPTVTLLAGSATGMRIDGTTLSVSEKSVAVFKVSYLAQYKAYRLNNVPTSLNGETSFPVVVVIFGTAP